jgi:hypothetical protein
VTAKKIPFSFQWAQAVSKSELDRNAKFFGLTLALFMDTKGACWPSTKTLQERTGRPRSWVSTQRTKLEKAGFLTVNRTAALASKSSCLHQAVVPSPVLPAEHVPVLHMEQRSEPVKRSEPTTKKEQVQKREEEEQTLELVDSGNLDSLQALDLDRELQDLAVAAWLELVDPKRAEHMKRIRDDIRDERSRLSRTMRDERPPIHALIAEKERELNRLAVAA